MSEPIRVLHCIGSMDRGGAETWLLRVLQHIDRRRYQLDFCCLSGRAGAYAREIEALGGAIHTCALSRNLAAFGRRFAQILTEGCYDIVHSHVHFFSGYLLRQAHRVAVRGRIAHSHNTADARRSTFLRRLYRAWMRRWIWQYANAGVAVSKEAGFQLFGPRWRSDSRWRTIYCGIDLDPFTSTNLRSEVREALGIPLDSFVVGHVGRFDPQKNHSFIIDVGRELIQRHPLTYLLLVGDGPLRPKIEDKARSLGLENHVIFTGVRRDVPALLSAMDVFMMPSFYEGLPVAGLEVQAAGIPAIFSDTITRDVCVVPELVTFLPVDSPPQVWSRQLLDLRDRRVDILYRRAVFEQKGYTIQASTAQLSSLYDLLARTDSNKDTA